MRIANAVHFAAALITVASLTTTPASAGLGAIVSTVQPKLAGVGSVLDRGSTEDSLRGETRWTR